MTSVSGTWDDFEVEVDLGGGGGGGGTATGGTSADARASGTVGCPGPFNIDDTEAAIRSDSGFKQALLDRARKAGDDPSTWTDRDLAITAVHGAHGGRDCIGNSVHDDAYRQLLSQKFPEATTNVPSVTNDPVEGGGGGGTTTTGGGGDNVIDEVIGWLEDNLGVTVDGGGQQQPQQQPQAAGLGMTEILLIVAAGIALVLLARQF